MGSRWACMAASKKATENVLKATFWVGATSRYMARGMKSM
jgi:hypothetical protein